MGFFGEIINNNKIEIPIPDGYILKLLNACISKNGQTSLYIQTNNEENGFIICHLDSNKIPQFSLQHEFGPEDSPILLWTTNESLHLTGNWIWDRDDNEDDEDDEEENEEDIQNDEEIIEKTDNNNDNDNNEENNQNSIQNNEVNDKKDKKQKNKKNKQSEKNEEQDNQSSSTDNNNNNSKKRIRDENNTTNQTNSKKSKKNQKDNNPIVPSSQLVVVSKPPSDKKELRPDWNITPLNNEGLLIPEPKQKTISSGVLITDYIIGYSNEPKFGSFISIIYQGLFPNGEIFDQQLDRKHPLTFRKGSGQVIRGLDLGLEGMRIGGSREIVIPPALGYGSKGVGKIPGNQTLVFRVTLIGEKKRRN